MRGARHDAADAHRARELRLERVGDVVLLQVARAPAGHVEEPVVQRQVDVRHQRRAGLEVLQGRRQHAGIRGLGRDVDHLRDRPPVPAVPVPQPDGGGQVLEADHAVDEAVRLGRVVGRPQLEDQLVLGPEVDLLHVAAPRQVPEVETSAVLAAEQELRDQPVLEHVVRAPLARHGRVVAEVPAQVVPEMLGPAVDLPPAADVEGLVVHQEHAARTLALGVAQRAHVDPLGPAVHGVRARVAGPLRHLRRLDHLDELGLLRVRLGVQDVDPRGTNTRHDQVAPLQVRVGRVRAEGGAARVPAEVVQLVTRGRHFYPADDRRACRRPRVDVDHGDAVGPPPLGVELRDVGDLLGRGPSRQARRGIERGVRCPGCHDALLSGCRGRSRRP